LTCLGVIEKADHITKSEDTGSGLIGCRKKPRPIEAEIRKRKLTGKRKLKRKKKTSTPETTTIKTDRSF
jgi:hypothetical protein